MVPAAGPTRAGDSMPSVTKMTPHMERRFEDERRRDLLVWIRRCTAFATIPLAVGLVLNLAVFQDRVGDRVLFFALETALILGAATLSRLPAAARWATPLAVAFIASVAAALMWSLTFSPGDVDVLVGTVVVTMLASALLFPWGGAAQLVVSTMMAVGYLSLPYWRTLEGARIANILVTLGDGVGLSLLGAMILERQRRATFVEREQAQALARQRELLLEVGRELNGTTALDDLLRRVVEWCREIVGCESAAFSIVEEKRGVLRTAAISSDRPDSPHELLDVEFRLEEAAATLDALRTDTVREVTYEGAPLDMKDGMRVYGVTCMLLVALRRGDRLLGFLNLNLKSPGARFDDDQKRLAEGLAHQAAVALINARMVEDLQAASRIKSEFVSTMSHELRTPLHVIMGYTEMLENDADAVDRTVALARIRGASRELLDLIDATLDLGRLESGRDAPEMGPLSLAEWWAELQADFAAVPRPAGVVLTWAPAPVATVVTDRRKLKIIAKNLLGNALKYTLAGEVAASLSVDGDEWTLTVRDTGVGIDAVQLPRIFDMFTQLDASDRRSFAGVGLGLYIVRRLADQLEARLDVTSAPGKGSTFRVRLPLRGAAAPARAA